MHATMMIESVLPLRFRTYVQNEVQNCMPREYARYTSFTYFLTGFFTATLLISNVLNCKIIRVAQLPFTGGLILFPLVALFADVLTEVYGYAETRKVIWTGLTSLMLLVVMVTICGALPSDPLWHNQAAYVALLGAVPRVAAASLIELNNSTECQKLQTALHANRRKLTRLTRLWTYATVRICSVTFHRGCLHGKRFHHDSRLVFF